jgi:hypothetical protein
MSEPTIPLEYDATAEDFRAVKDAAARECKCSSKVKGAYKAAQTEGCTEKVKVCKPCAARLLCNGLSTLSEDL